MKKHRSSQQQSDITETAPEFADEAFRGARIWRDGEALHIDVRNLEPPDPLVATISLIESPGVKGPVYFHHDRDPMLLYQELAERGWKAKVVYLTEEKVLLELSPIQPAGDVP